MIHFDPANPLILAPALKTIMIPTTSGTGSESTFVAVITDTETHQKCGCIVWANAAIVDPDLTLDWVKQLLPTLAWMHFPTATNVSVT